MTSESSAPPVALFPPAICHAVLKAGSDRTMGQVALSVKILTVIRVKTIKPTKPDLGGLRTRVIRICVSN